jgi:hypothetical protein
MPASTKSLTVASRESCKDIHNCTSETLKARLFELYKISFNLLLNGLAYIVSDVEFCKLVAQKIWPQDTLQLFLD